MTLPRSLAAAALVVLPSLPVAAESAAPVAFDPARTSFAVKVRDETIGYRELAVPVMPEATVPLSIERTRSGAFTAEASAGALKKVGGDAWQWKAPSAAGIYPLAIRDTETGESIRLNMAVLVPRSRVQGGQLNGYRIDAYPSAPYKGLATYNAPSGFIEVTEANLDTLVAPHFTLGQFLCKQDGGFPKYVVLRERLLLKLELLLEHANASGFRTDTFHVMSGYRTPYYNRAIGNVKHSRHVYGGAADIFIDENPRDGVMDDLNGDGKVSLHDALVLYELFDQFAGSETYAPFVGGLGLYDATDAHGPFVHVDVRGFRARWGK